MPTGLVGKVFAAAASGTAIGTAVAPASAIASADSLSPTLLIRPPRAELHPANTFENPAPGQVTFVNHVISSPERDSATAINRNMHDECRSSCQRNVNGR